MLTSRQIGVERRMRVVDARIQDGHLDALAIMSFVVDAVDLTHDVRRESVLLACRLDCLGRGTRGLVLGSREDLDRVD